MKKEEAIKFLSDTKVYVDGKSKEIQEKLFELGFSWQMLIDIEASTDKMFDIPFLFMDECLNISHSSSMTHFKHAKNREIKADEILSIEIEKECLFKPFDKVLVRDKEDEQWKAGIFSHIETVGGSPFPFVTTSSCFKMCIPYEGNEDLVGTNKSPKLL